MADGVVSFLIENLSRLLVDEAKLLSGVEGKIKSLINELKFIDIFLKSSEGKRNNDMVKEVVNQIRDVAHEAQDVVDNYVANVSLQRSRNILGKIFHCIGQVMMLHDVDAEIEEIKKSIDEIYKNKGKYGIGEGEFQSGGETEAAELLRKRRRDVEEEEVVGLVHDSNVIIKQLIKSDSRLHVLSIIGMGGLGKTTLARKIYNNSKVKDMFPFHAWGYVSNEYKAKELLLSLLRCLMSSASKYKDQSEEELKEHVRECLNRKKYLVVLDDIWKTEVWDDVQGAFPDDNNGSRILITSRIKEVASYKGTTPPYSLPFLTKEESWELFCKKVFRGEDCPSNLKDIGMSIVESCGGLPLAIVVLAGLVAKKDKSQREWLRIKGHVSWHLAQENNIKVMDILKLSYDSLPQRLKSCFLYFGIYPEDYEIPVKQLIQLWVAEGFIQPPEIGTSNTPELEDIGEYYLDELVDRSLVEVTSKRSDEGVKTCQIHDLLRDLCISESQANKFMEVCTEVDIDKCNARRISLHHNTQFSFPPTEYNQSHTRSLFLFGEDLYWNNESKGCKQIRKSFKLARVLHLNKVFLDLPPSGLKSMIHLRYLRIKTDSRSAKNILASICNLWNLETLHLSCDWMFSIPINIWKLKRLRHFNVRVKEISRMSRVANSEKMSNLQTLCEVPLYSQMISMLNNDCFPNVKKLGLWCYPYFKDGSVDKQSLRGISDLSLLSMHHLSKLRTLKIRGDIFSPFCANGFSPNFFPSDLTKITLIDFKELDSKALGRLSNLRILKLKRGSTGDGLHCAAGEFPALQMIQMKDVRVERWILEKDAMPCLSRLLIKGGELENLPEQLRSLTTIK